ncbi:MAG TPA: NAD(P)/FAD-dependent oxidoreductase [Candidatus Paceibacterota bacterium]
MTKKHVVIVGGGFGGTYTAKYLKPLIKKNLIDVTIINRNNYFLFTSLLHEVATGGLSPTSVVEPIREIFRHSNVHFAQDEVESIDSVKKEVSTSTSIIPYDYLVFSSGSETNYYGVVGAKENTFGLKNLSDAQILRKQLIDSCENGALTNNEEEKKKLLSCIIIGAGATGVELSAEILEFMHHTLCSYYKICGLNKDHMKITLVSASPDVLPQFPPNLRELAKLELIEKGIRVMTNENVTEVQWRKVIFADKSFITAGTIVWVAGVKPTIIDIPNTEREKSGRIKTDQFLRVTTNQEKTFAQNTSSQDSSSQKSSHIFSLGDVSGTAPMLAQVAVQQAKIVAKNISADIFNTPLTPFIFKQKGLLVSLGQWYAIGNIYGIIMKGPFMWLIWRTVYLFNFHSWRKRLKIGIEWTINFFYPRDITEI